MKYNSTPLAVMSDRNLVITESSSGSKCSTLIPVGVDRVESLEQLIPEEQRERYQLELRVEQAFYQAGKALAELRDRRLYRSTHKTFEAYCQDRFNFTRRYSDYLIAATTVVKNLQQMRTIHSQNELHENASTISAQILPTRLEQIKPLASLEPDEQRQVWDKAVETANGKVPSGRIVSEIVAQLKEKPLVLAQDNCQVGDVFTLVGLEGQQKKYNGCSCIATELTDSTVTVDVHNATLTVKLENLNEIASSDDKQQLPQTLRRLRRLREVKSLDRGAANILKDLSKRTNLTPVEEGLLSWIENYYSVTE